MIFTTYQFIVFMAVVFIIYYLIPKGKQWQLLLIASYVFYAFAAPVYLLFLVFITSVTYVGGLLIEKNQNAQEEYLKQHKELSKDEKKACKTLYAKKCKQCAAAVVVLLLLLLGIFKYSDFILQSAIGIIRIFKPKTEDIVLNLILPVGLSFYMFQSMGYCIDVCRQMTSAEHNFFKYAAYVAFFPQLLQGPIGEYHRLAPQIFAEHEFSYKNAKYGLQRIAWGFFKKLVIANQISVIIDDFWEGEAPYTGFVFWGFVLVMYSIQLYSDFSGYMDIAIGCAQMLGITMDENFDCPYFSTSIARFWRKWHITLGAWFRNYVFYSLLRTKWLDGIRKKYRKTNAYISATVPNVFALLIVWTLIGFWHGADWSYVVYGLYHGFFIILSTLLVPAYAKIDNRFPHKNESSGYRLFQIIRTFLIVTFGYVIFRPANLASTSAILGQMFSSFGLMDTLTFGRTIFRRFLKISVGTIVLFIVDIWHFRSPDASLRDKINTFPVVIRWIIYLLLLWTIILLGEFGQSSFIYFKF